MPVSYTKRGIALYFAWGALGREREREREKGLGGGGGGAEEGQSPSVQRSQLLVSLSVKVPV